MHVHACVYMHVYTCMRISMCMCVILTEPSASIPATNVLLLFLALGITHTLKNFQSG